jgi:hypothetical protein
LTLRHQDQRQVSLTRSHEQRIFLLHNLLIKLEGRSIDLRQYRQHLTGRAKRKSKTVRDAHWKIVGTLTYNAPPALSRNIRTLSPTFRPLSDWMLAKTSVESVYKQPVNHLVANKESSSRSISSSSLLSSHWATKMLESSLIKSKKGSAKLALMIFGSAPVSSSYMGKICARPRSKNRSLD